MTIMPQRIPEPYRTYIRLLGVVVGFLTAFYVFIALKEALSF